jgi:hypothetical protein
MNFRAHWKAGNFLTSWVTNSFSRRTLLHGVVNVYNVTRNPVSRHVTTLAGRMQKSSRGLEPQTGCSIYIYIFTYLFIYLFIALQLDCATARLAFLSFCLPCFLFRSLLISSFFLASLSFFFHFLLSELGSSVSIVTRLRAVLPGFYSWQRLGIFLFGAASGPARPPPPPQPLIQRVPGNLSPGLKRLGREADHSPLCSTEVNALSYTSTPSVRLHGLRQLNTGTVLPLPSPVFRSLVSIKFFCLQLHSYELAVYIPVNPEDDASWSRNELRVFTDSADRLARGIHNYLLVYLYPIYCFSLWIRYEKRTDWWR